MGRAVDAGSAGPDPDSEDFDRKHISSDRFGGARPRSRADGWFRGLHDAGIRVDTDIVHSQHASVEQQSAGVDRVGYYFRRNDADRSGLFWLWRQRGERTGPGLRPHSAIRELLA